MGINADQLKEELNILNQEERILEGSNCLLTQKFHKQL